MDTVDSLLWKIRHFIYQYFVDTTHPPGVDVTAAHFNISAIETREYYMVLHNHHVLFLDLDSFAIRVADPFTGIPTDFKVHTNGRTYFAKCTWEAIGIPAVLHSNHAVIEAVCTGSNESVRLEIIEGRVADNDLLIHFSPPASLTDDDLVFT